MAREPMSASMPLPPDRSHIATEQRHPDSAAFDALSVRECIDLLARDQHEAVRAVERAAPAIAAFALELVPRLQRGGRLVYAGAGTSGRLGVLDASECPPTFRAAPGQIVGLIAGGDGALRVSSEGKEDDADGACDEFDVLGLGVDDTVVGIAAGGTTPFARGAVTMAKARGALTAFLCCAPCEPPTGCDHVLLVDTGPEVITGSTRLKAGTATKIALNCLSTTLFTQLGKVHGNLMVDLAATNDKLVDRAVRIFCALHPGVSREHALHRLSDADGNLKCALVMHAAGIDADQARERLARAGGVLRRAITG